MSKNSNYSLSLTCRALYKGEQEIEFQFDPYNDCTDMDSLKEMAKLEIETHDDFEVEPDGIDEKDISIEITDYDGIPENYANEKDLWDFAEAFAESSHDIDVIEAALYCGVEPRNIDEAYQGTYKDDEEFAQEMAEQLGALDKNASWPMNCIDWEHAARELMMDYSDHNGHYFRNF